MKKLTKQYRIITLTMVLFFGGFIVKAIANASQPDELVLMLAKAKSLRLEHPDSAVFILKEVHTRALEKADTLLMIEALNELASAFGHQARYKDSYDQLWAALSLADAAQLKLSKASVYRAIGRYYSFYHRKNNASKFLGLSLDIKKQLVEDGNIEASKLARNYHSFVATYRELNEPELGRTYLDSSFLYHTPGISNINISFLKFEQAVLLNQEQKSQEALEIFYEILPWYSTNLPGYQVLIYHYMGDAYLQLTDFDESERCYKKALELSEKFNSHLDFTPLVYERLANLYFAGGDNLQAYKSLKKAKELDAVFFDSRSESNSPLLEIQDAFRQEKEAQEQLLQKQRLSQLEQEERVSFLEKIILIGCMAFLILMSGLYFNYVRSKHRSEKQLLRKEREMETQKTNEIVELKNKELAASVLKLIEKDAFIEGLKEKLAQGKGDIKRQEVKQLIRSISSTSNGNWKEFEARFVSINKSFYDKLDQKFPNLTQGDQKICALVKLNFSSKDMSRLLGISVESVHTTRSRLRKKLNLSRDTNLTEFIANI